MKKNIYFAALLLVMSVFTGCKYYNDYYYVILKNSTRESISVRLLEDGETRKAQKYGQQDKTVTLKTGQTKTTDVICCSYFKIYVNGTDVTAAAQKDAAESDTFVYIGEGMTTVITKTEDSFSFEIKDSTVE